MKFPVVALCALSMLAAAPASAEPKARIDWVDGYDIAVKVARRELRPLLIEITEDCIICKELKASIWPNQQIAAAASRYVAVSLWTGNSKQLATLYGMRGIPSLIVADPWGDAIARIESTMTLQDVLRLLETAPKDFSPLKMYRDVLEKDSTNGKAMMGVARFYHQAGIYGLSSRYFRLALKSPAAKDDPALGEEAGYSLAVNALRMQNWDDVRKSLTDFQRDYPKAAKRSEAWVGLVLSNLRLNNPAEANQALERLKAEFPGSQELRTAESIIAQAGSSAAK